MTPRIGSLFSGYGGLDLAVQRVYGGEVVWYSEIDKHACTVLAAHYPGVPNLGDITTVSWTDVEPVDVLTGGYPCQPFSHAGQRKGSDDARHLWPHIAAALRAGVLRRGGVAVFENVDGHRSLGLADVLADLASLGMSARWGVVRAADAGAPHGRKRVFIVAHPAGQEWRHGHDQNSLPIQIQSRGGVGKSSTPNADLTGSEARRTSPGGACGDQTAGQRQLVGSDAATRRGLAANPDRDGYGGGQDSRGVGSLEAGHEAATSQRQRSRQEPGAGVDWGKYKPAIRRWESVLGRPAPAPTVPGTNGRPRLSPYFVEWMMGLEPGHVTGHGLKPAACLKMLGNGVVPQQAELALRMLAVADA